MKIKAILLDFGGTLADGRLDWDPYHESIRSYLSSHGYYIGMQKLKKSLRAALAELEKIRSKGKEMPFDEVYTIFLSNLEIRYDNEMLEWLHMNYRKNFKTNFYPCVEDVLKKLAKKYKIALISNTISNQPKLLLNEVGYNQYFDLIITSEELGIRKPNPKIFKKALKELGVKPDEAVHVGDNVESDMYGARDSDITGIWIKTPRQALWTGYAINNICELPGFLEKINK